MLSILCSCRQPSPQVSKTALSVSSYWQGALASAWGSVSLPAMFESCCLLAVLRLTRGNRAMQASIPKQYLELLGQPIAVYSLLTFMAMPEVGEVIIVCDPSYR